MNTYKNKIAITTGDFNGIGAEITIKALNELCLPKDEVVIISNKEIINFYGNLKIPYEIINIDYKGEVLPGKISPESGDFSYNSLKTVCEISPKAIVTAPVSKEALHIAGHLYNGQTEILQNFLAKNNQKAEMLFISDYFDVFLLTRHCALKDINITKQLIFDKIVRLSKFYNNNVEFALCALNPHAGESGILGKEEISEIIPAVKELRLNGIKITDPLPADTLFINAVQNSINQKPAPYKCYIAMYHDQGLIPIKSAAINRTVNTTIGLPILRTSPAHGTAFDIAGKNIANYNSMIAAIRTSIKYQNRIF